MERYGRGTEAALGSAVMLHVGLWVSEVVVPAATVFVTLMLSALAMHVRVKGPAMMSLPAFLMLAMSANICVLEAA